MLSNVVDDEEVEQAQKDEDIFWILNLLAVRDVENIRWKIACVVGSFRV